MSEVGRKDILLIGGNSGMGKCVLDRLSQAGHTIAVAARNPDAVAKGDRVTVQPFDATDSAAQLDVPEALDAVIYLPGTINLKPFQRLKLEEFEQDMAVNFLGAVRVLQQALPALKKARSGRGSVVLFSSVAAGTGMSFHSSIAPAKAAVEGLTLSLAAELAPSIRVNAIAPSLTDTPLAAGLLGNEERAKAAAERHPLKRVGDPGEIAELVEFLIGNASGFMTGQILRPDGGMSSTRQL